MGKDKHFKFKGFLNFSYEAEIHVVPKTWESGISIVQEKHEKTQTFQIYGFLKNFGWSRNPCNSQNIGKVNLNSTGKTWKNTGISHIFRYLVDLELTKTYAIPNVSEYANSHKMEIFCGKPYHSQAMGLWGN